MLGLWEDERREAGGSNLLAENGYVEAGALFYKGDGVLTRVRGGGRVGEDGNEVVGFAVAEGGSNIRIVKEKLLVVAEGSGAGEEAEQRDEGWLALLAKLMWSSLQRKKAR